MPKTQADPPARPLAGLVVMVTRPAGQAEPLCQLLTDAGADPLRFPVLEILDNPDRDALNDVVDRLDEFDWAIFISPNAVEKAVNLIHARRNLPTSLKLATIGKSSAGMLEKMLGRQPDLCPAYKFNSEALLAMPELQTVSGQRFVIFRGDGGREHLADTLRARGASIEYANTYRRARPAADVEALQRRWARDGVDVIVITSGEGLRNLFDMVGNLAQHWLQQTQLVVVNQRLADIARELGFEKPAVVANEASDPAIIDAIQRWRNTQHDQPRTQA